MLSMLTAALHLRICAANWMWVCPGTAQSKTATASRAKGRESGALDRITVNNTGKEEGKALPLKNLPTIALNTFSSPGLHFNV